MSARASKAHCSYAFTGSCSFIEADGRGCIRDQHVGLAVHVLPHELSSLSSVGAIHRVGILLPSCFEVYRRLYSVVLIGD